MELILTGRNKEVVKEVKVMLKKLRKNNWNIESLSEKEYGLLGNVNLETMEGNTWIPYGADKPIVVLS